MKQILITTPYGTLATQPCTSEEMAEVELKLFSQLGHLTHIKLFLDSGNLLYMSEDMIGQCIFEVATIS